MSIKLNSFLYHIISKYNNSKIFNPNISSEPTDNESPYISEENENEGYLYLLFIDLLIFSSLTYLTYKKSQNIEKISDNPDNFNLQFMKWLVIANALRTLSLIFILIISNPNGNNGISWINSILHVVPAFVFVTCYMFLADFLSNFYYKNISYENHLIRPALTFIINGSYFFLALIALITLFIKAYKTFFYISELLMALLYLLLGYVIFYYGRKASQIFESQGRNSNYESHQKDPNNFGVMGLSLGGLFLLKGICGLLEGIKVFSPPNHNVFDFFWFLILEVSPTAIVIYLSKIIIKNKEEDTPRNTLNEMESSFQRDSSYKPDFEKD